MKAVEHGEIGLSDAFIDEMHFCLDCRACESACPAGVRYASLVEAARAKIDAATRTGAIKRFTRWLLLRKILGTNGGLRVARRLVFLLQKSGLISFLQWTRFPSLISQRLQRSVDLLPDANNKSYRTTLSKKAEVHTRQTTRVGLLSGCIMDAIFADVNADTISLLEYHGCKVEIPKGQACCGALQAHSGDIVAARRLAAQNVRAFGGVDVVVMNSAGCGAFMKQYGELLAENEEMAQLASEVAAKVKDLSESLVDIGLDVKRTSTSFLSGKRVTYHDACHLVHAQKVFDQPRQLIRSIPNLEYVELPESTWCCGSAGLYNITHYQTADELLKRKLKNIRDIRADVVVTSNPGCLLQLRLGLERKGVQTELLHLATFLRRACCD